MFIVISLPLFWPEAQPTQIPYARIRLRQAPLQIYLAQQSCAQSLPPYTVIGSVVIDSWARIYLGAEYDLPYPYFLRFLQERVE